MLALGLVALMLAVDGPPRGVNNFTIEMINTHHSWGLHCPAGVAGCVLGDTGRRNVAF